MGVTLDLRLIDHERIVVRGREVLNVALRDNAPNLLRDYLATLSIEVNQEVVDYRMSRLAKLREYNAPSIIIENEERQLRYANGDAYRPCEFEHATFDDLRQMLGTWCWPAYSYSLDKSWAELDWFLNPVEGPMYALCPHRPEVGDPKQTIFDVALHGAKRYPLDDRGDPVIGTLGSTERDCYGYNPPDVVQRILSALRQVDPATWENHAQYRRDLYRKENPTFDEEDIRERVENDLSFAREALSIMVSAYTKAAEMGFGVSCEYCL